MPGQTKDPAKGPGKGERKPTLYPAPRTGAPMRAGWDGPTYYGRSQLKPSPFDEWLVGGYIFLAGLSGSSSLLGTVADTVGGPKGKGIARRSRWLSLLAPTIGSALLILDLHTPQRFYNMLRVFKPRSPMSIGTWILMTFGAGSVPAAIAGFLGERVPFLGWLKPISKIAQAPAAISGAGLSVYTASLLAATSAPAWAAAPRALAVRFGASSVASGASALMIGERDPDARRALQVIAAGALAVEAGAAMVQSSTEHEKGVAESKKSRWGRVETVVATGLGVALPLALFGLSLARGKRRGSGLADAAAVATLVGSAALRVSILGVGDDSAARPEISLRFAQPRNLPKEPQRTRVASRPF